MHLDYHTLLAAFFLSGCGLASAFLVSWLVSRKERFLVIWTFGVLLMALGALVYGWYAKTMSPVIGAAGYTALLTGLAFVFGAACEFRTGILPWRRVAAFAIVPSIAMAVPMLAGQNGISMILLNLAAPVILFMTAREHWLGRAEARAAMALLTGLYIVTGLSFVPCALLLLQAGEWRLPQAPSNWAEDVNLGICLITLAGIGALSLALNQARLARGHKRDAETDALTGLLNRRALLDHIAHGAEGPASLIIFDIDRFKAINDVHGHPAGDEVLRTFGEILLLSGRSGLAARLGGEEFALLVPGASLVSAAMLADGVRMRLAKRHFSGNGCAFSSTVSAGVSQSDAAVSNFDTMLSDADNALYAAKRNGRNRIAVSSDSTEFLTQFRSPDGHRGPIDLVRLKTG
ncbi:GGDEF domain-containing protein [Enterovirga rhinocerotis]|uniref:diguanylate cyclase n=1 Tax=Enterovirga rhinocerotis TaxID=1339210 RepID=A0A4R7BTQ0_9HYPH|nr:diguanylate cyclase [Enterovirga rhinocerotis]TDR89128.1 diguanylate cyclase (GGDEF)-like protein [Enterovirga rhinocerotis]